MNARLGRGLRCSAASPPSGRRPTTARDLTNSNPNNLPVLRADVPPFQTLYKASAAYRLPYEIQLAGIVPGAAGHQHRRRLHVHQRAWPARPLTGGVSSITRQRRRSDDARSTTTSRPTTCGSRGSSGSEPARLQAFMEIFNLVNDSTILTRNETVRAPTVVQPDRSRDRRAGSSSGSRSTSSELGLRLR